LLISRSWPKTAITGAGSWTPEHLNRWLSAAKPVRFPCRDGYLRTYVAPRRLLNRSRATASRMVGRTPRRLERSRGAIGISRARTKKPCRERADVPLTLTFRRSNDGSRLPDAGGGGHTLAATGSLGLRRDFPGKFFEGSSIQATHARPDDLYRLRPLSGVAERARRQVDLAPFPRFWARCVWWGKPPSAVCLKVNDVLEHSKAIDRPRRESQYGRRPKLFGARGVGVGGFVC